MNLASSLILLIILIIVITLVIGQRTWSTNSATANMLLLISKYKEEKKKVSILLNSFDFVKGLKHASALPLLPFKLANYHKSFLGRMLRVIGGLAAFIVLTSNTELALIDNEYLANNNLVLYYLIGILGLSHLFYMMTIFGIKLMYIIYHILKGNWIHRNSPLKYIMTESSGVMLCVKGVCVVSGFWFAAAGIAGELDTIIGEDYFKELAVIKKPALLLKSSVSTLNDSIYFGNYNNSAINTTSVNSTNNITNISDSNILNKLTEQEKLTKLKTSITSKPEIKQVFDNLKNELQVDIVKDIDAKLKALKKK